VPRRASIWGLEHISDEEYETLQEGRYKDREVPTEATLKARKDAQQRREKTVIVGIDLGKEVDATVLCLVEPTVSYEEPIYLVHNVIPVRLGTSYATIISSVASLDEQLRLRKNAVDIKYVVDAGGAGGVVDSLEEALPKADIYKVHITSGYESTIHDDFKIGLPKREWVTTLKKVLEAKRVKFHYTEEDDRRDAGMRLLESEINNFQMKILQTGYDRYEASSGHHDDAVQALGLAVWFGEREAGRGPLRIW
jgi:RNA-binding protein YhbY